MLKSNFLKWSVENFADFDHGAIYE